MGPNPVWKQSRKWEIWMTENRTGKTIIDTGAVPDWTGSNGSIVNSYVKIFVYISPVTSYGPYKLDTFTLWMETFIILQNYYFITKLLILFMSKNRYSYYYFSLFRNEYILNVYFFFYIISNIFFKWRCMVVVRDGQKRNRAKP